jgi:hypothetical protein
MHSRGRARLPLAGAIGTVACALLLSAYGTSAAGRLNLPQSEEKAVLSAPARQALEAAIGATSGSGSFALASEPAAQVVQSLPKDFGDSCREMVGSWGAGAKETARWTIRSLYSFREVGGTEVVLALRCGSTAPEVQAYYDERPAILSLTQGSGSLGLVPLAADCLNCAMFYHLEFSQTFSVVEMRLAELRVSYVNDSPCCDGGDQKSGEQLVILGLPDGKTVRAVEQSTEELSHDDSVEDGDSDTACRAKIDYSRDRAGNVESIRTETRCTENKKPVPEVWRRSFRWNAGARRFDEVKESAH